MIIPKVLESEEVYKGKIITIKRDTLTRGDGKNFVRETAVSSDAIGSRDDDDVLIAELPDDYIKEYRENSLCWQRLCSAKQSVYTEILENYVGIEQ